MENSPKLIFSRVGIVDCPAYFLSALGISIYKRQ